MVKTKIKILNVFDSYFDKDLFRVKVEASIENTKCDFTVTVPIKIADSPEKIQKLVLLKIKDEINEMRRRYNIYRTLKELEGKELEIELD